MCRRSAISFVLIFLSLHSLSFQASPRQWKSRSIYQILTDRFARTDGSTTAPCDPGEGIYCGGTWQGVINQLDYIQGMGFTAIWISPVTLNLLQETVDLESYHGYWQQNLYAVNPEFGSMDDLKNLSDALHQRDMYLMLDVVVGDMAWAGSPSSVDYSVFDPFNSQDYFHPWCNITEPNNLTQLQDCWLGDNVVSLPDLKTEDPVVAKAIYSWISSLVSNYSVDGLRVDSVRNLSPDFLPGLDKSAGIYCIGEVFDGNSTSACKYQDYLDGFLNYPIYFPATRAFQNTSGTMDDLVAEIASERSACKDVTLLGTFVENHDLGRFASYTSDMSLAQNIMSFNMLYEGIPVLYYGQEQHLNGSFNPLNREALWLTKYNISAPLYGLASALNAVRTQAIKANASYLDYVSVPIWTDSHGLALRKGFDGNQIITVVNNHGANSNFSMTLNETGFNPGELLQEIVSCTTSTVGPEGELVVKVENGAPQVFYSAEALGGPAICSATWSTGKGEGGNNSSSTSGSGSPHVTNKPTSMAAGIERWHLFWVRALWIGLLGWMMQIC